MKHYHLIAFAGVLMGKRAGRTVEVHSVLPVPVQLDSEGEEASIGTAQLNTFVDLHKRVYPAEEIIGWYSTCSDGKPLTEVNAGLHEFFVDRADNADAVFLSVDTSLQQAHIQCDAYINRANQIVSRVLADFTSLDVRIVVDEASRVGLDAMLRGKETLSETETVTSLSTSLEALETSMVKVKDMLSSCIGYVETVASGSRAGDAALGRALADACSAVPHLDAAEFGEMFNAGLHDMLMVSYLSSLTQTHVSLAERIGRSVQAAK
jgi:hypothetical protein